MAETHNTQKEMPLWGLVKTQGQMPWHWQEGIASGHQLVLYNHQ